MQLESKHSPPELLRRIESALPKPALALWSSTAVVGRVSAPKFVLSLRRAWFQNSFAPQCVGTVKPSGAGSNVSLRFRFHPWILPFVIAFPGALLFMIGGAVVPALADSSSEALRAALDEVAPVLLTAVIFGAVSYASWRFDRPHLVAFVKKHSIDT